MFGQKSISFPNTSIALEKRNYVLFTNFSIGTVNKMLKVTHSMLEVFLTSGQLAVLVSNNNER